MFIKKNNAFIIFVFIITVAFSSCGRYGKLKMPNNIHNYDSNQTDNNQINLQDHLNNKNTIYNNIDDDMF